MSNKARIRNDIESMSAYTPTTSLEVFAERLGMAVGDLIKLDANENPFGPSPRVKRALAQLANMQVYPDPESGRLRELLADYAGVSKESILCGAGADELIEIILQLFIEPGDAIINTPPTFAMYGFDAPLYHAKVIDVYRREDFSLDVDAIETAVHKHSSKLVFLCSPNNPSGNMINRADILRLLEVANNRCHRRGIHRICRARQPGNTGSRVPQLDRLAHNEQVGGIGWIAHRLWHLPGGANAAFVEDQATL